MCVRGVMWSGCPQNGCKVIKNIQHFNILRPKRRVESNFFSKNNIFWARIIAIIKKMLNFAPAFWYDNK